MRYDAIIGKNGEIQDLEFSRGPLIFYEAAREAVSQWKYQPTLLSGEPVEVVTQIDVNYTLSR